MNSRLQRIFLAALVVCLVLLELVFGGTRLVLSLPAYGILAFAAMVSLLYFRRSHCLPDQSCLIFTGLFLAYVFLRIVFSPVPYLARRDLFIALSAGIVYLFTAFHLNSPEHRWIIVKAMLGLVVANFFLCLYQFLSDGGGVFIGVLLSQESQGKVTGLFHSPDHLAGFMGVAVALGLSLIVWTRRSRRFKVMTGSVVLMGVVTALLAGSRSGFCAILVSVAAFFVLSRIAMRHGGNARFRLAMAGSFLLLTLAGVGLTLLISGRAGAQDHGGEWVASHDHRLDLWDAAVKQFKQAPVLGTGSGTSAFYGRQLRNPAMMEGSVYSQNDYLELLAEYGLAGLVSLLLVLTVHASGGLRTFHWLITERCQKLGRLQSDILALNVGALSALAGMAVHAVFDFNLHIPSNALLAAFILGILANAGTRVPLTISSCSRKVSHMKFAVPALGLCIFLAGLPQWFGELGAERALESMRDNDYQEVLARARQGLKYDPKNPYLYLYRAEALVEIAKKQELNKTLADSLLANACEEFESGLKLFPQNNRLLLGMGEALDSLRRYPLARPYFETAVYWEPNSYTVRSRFARHLHQAGRVNEAWNEYAKSQELFPNYAARQGLQKLALDFYSSGSGGSSGSR